MNIQKEQTELLDKHGVIFAFSNEQFDEHSEAICHICPENTYKENAAANAQLIASAPDMLEALERITDWMEGNAPTPQYVYDAINKAKGIE